MQKSFIAIALALTLTCAFAAYTPIAAGYVKAPQSVAGDNESNFTASSLTQLVSVNIGELDLLGSNQTAGTTLTTNSWTAAYRKLDGKALTASTNSSVSFTGGLNKGQVIYLNGYAISFAFENDTNSKPQISVYQTPVNGGAGLARIFVTSNNNSWWNPQLITTATISKTVYVFYTAVNTSSTANQVNVTNFVAGGAKGSLEFNLTTTYSGNLSVVWGEALGSNQLFANWWEAGALKDATIDVSKGTVAVTVVGAWNVNFTCSAFSTDKKLFGDICSDSLTTPGNTTIYVRSSNATLNPLANNFTNTSSYSNVYAYGPYIAILYSGSVSNNGTTTKTYGYDIWNVDSFTAFRNRTNFLTTDGTGLTQFFRVTSGGLYSLLANINSATVNGTTVTNFSSIQVGLVLGSSYLTSVLGFILTIVAGLLLF